MSEFTITEREYEAVRAELKREQETNKRLLRRIAALNPGSAASDIAQKALDEREASSG